MSLLIWIIVFIISVAVLVKAADIFTDNSEKFGIALGIPAFIIGLSIVAVGTTLPELSTSFVSVFQGATEIITANAVGSIVTNILLVVGLSALLAKKLIVKKDLVEIYVPFLIGSMLILFFIILDGKVVFTESLILVLGFFVYLFYIFSQKKKIAQEIKEIKEVVERKDEKGKNFFAGLLEILEEMLGIKKERVLLKWQNIFLIVLGAFFVYLGAKYTVESLINIAFITKISSAAIAMSALAIGTSLPELAVSITAALKGREEIGISNIIGASILNSFIIVGLPGLFSSLIVDPRTIFIGIPFGAAAVLFFVFSGLDRKIYNWEGFIYLLIFVLFISKLFGLF